MAGDTGRPRLAARIAGSFGVRALGLAGQMHGAVLLDASDQVLRPAILWNDGRSGAECAALEQAQPASRGITGNLAMPGFTAPKLLWVRRHEPEIFARTRRVLLPKDWLRLRLTGEAVSEMSDASGTLWLDVAARRWSGAMLDATGLSEAQMPALVEGTAPTGRLRPEMAALLGLPAGIPVAGGAGDNAAGAVGIGCVSPGDAFLSSAPPASSLSAIPASCRTRRGRCMPSAIACQEPGIACRSSSPPRRP
ncbi:FGGY family carbohydrate kinase [Pseudoroseomonas wenyumeiae]